jgi:hypothetical protein
MSAKQPTRRSVFATSAAAAAVSLLPDHLAAAPDAIKEVTAMTNAIRPFRINVPDEALVDLCRRARATRWPQRETVTRESRGVQLATIQELASYWAADYDWRKVEARLNAYMGLFLVEFYHRMKNTLTLLGAWLRADFRSTTSLDLATARRIASSVHPWNG